MKLVHPALILAKNKGQFFVDQWGGGYIFIEILFKDYTLNTEFEPPIYAGTSKKNCVWWVCKPILNPWQE